MDIFNRNKNNVTDDNHESHKHVAFNGFETPGESGEVEPWRQNDDDASPQEEPAASEPEQEPTPFPLRKNEKFGRRNVDSRIHTTGKHVEALIKQLGWDGDTYTTEVANEVKQIQEENGLVPSGRVDAITWNVIFNNR